MERKVIYNDLRLLANRYRDESVRLSRWDYACKIYFWNDWTGELKISCNISFSFSFISIFWYRQTFVIFNVFYILLTVNREARESDK